MTSRESNATQANNSSLLLQVSTDLTVQVTKNTQHEFLMTTSEVAHGYDCSIDAVLAAKKRNPNDFIEGKHFIQGNDNLSAPFDKDTADNLSAVKTENLKPNQIFWTKRGIIRLGFKLTSSRAVLFRDWAEDLILNQLEKTYKLPFREDEKKLVAIVNQYLIKGDVKHIAQTLNLTPGHVSCVKNGRKRSLNVFQALVNKAKYNKDNNLYNGYTNTFVQTALNLFNA